MSLKPTRNMHVSEQLKPFTYKIKFPQGYQTQIFQTTCKLKTFTSLTIITHHFGVSNGIITS